MSIYIFYHIYCNNHTFDILKNQIHGIIFSGLYDNVSKIYCCVTGHQEHIDKIVNYINNCGKKFIIHKCVPNDTTFERFTLCEIFDIVVPEDKFLYIHTKGITRPHNIFVQDWRIYMEYFLIKNYKQCISLLNNYDTVGVNHSTNVSNHYSGNFWWCTGKYYLSMNKEQLYIDKKDNFLNYVLPEMFILSNNAKFFTIHYSQTNHYESTYEYKQYVDK